MRRVSIFSLLLLLSMNARADEYKASVDEWHAGRLSRLHSETGYLSLVGLYRLSEGTQSIGSAADNDFVFPEKAPARVGTVTVQDGVATFRAAEGVAAKVGEESVTEIALASDRAENTTIVQLGDLSFYVIERPGDQLLLRLKDRNSALLQSFSDDIERYPVDPKWNVKATWRPHDPPIQRSFADVLGATEQVEIPGSLEFTIDGKSYTIDPIIDEDAGDLFIIFADKTNGKTTYGGGRFIHVPFADENGVTWIDFNRAYNPPCVFTAFSTCQYPPKENRLPIEVPAGEKTWHGTEHAER